MKTLFGNLEKGILIEVDFTNGFKDRLEKWLKEKQNDIFCEICFWEGGSIEITPDEIRFWGDDGIFHMERIDIVNV
tara:strand:- start:1527 stop:1754 length:228 start_codon:yes stop_codon:yes gene_type:complete